MLTRLGNSFNPKLVRLKVASHNLSKAADNLFQFQTGSIRSEQRDFSHCEGQFQSQTGSIRRRLLQAKEFSIVSFNPKLVRLEERRPNKGEWSKQRFNPKLVRLEGMSTQKIICIVMRFNPKLVRLEG